MHGGEHVGRGTQPDGRSVGRSQGASKEVAMSPLLFVWLAMVGPFVGVAVYDLQIRLECWAQERHAQD